MSPGAREIVIVGGGLVGSLLAVDLARRGFTVTVHERRSDPRRAGAEGGRSINLVLTRRGVRALERVGLARAALRLTVPVTGRMMHAVDGALAYQPYGRDESECNHSVSRGELNAFLIDAAEAAGARFRFGERLVDLDPGARVLTFDDGVGHRSTVEGVPALGADGAGSAVREALVRRGLVDETVDLLAHGYKELTLPAGPGGAPRIERRALHIWPRGELMLMALANRDGSFTTTLYLPHAGEHGFERLDRPECVRRLFDEQFPDAVPLLPDLVDEFSAHPTGTLGTVRCAPWHAAGDVLLLGDAAHAIVPFFGQGMNTGFEDCRILGELIDAGPAVQWSAIFAELDRRRKPAADAIAAMALENFDEMRDRVGDRRFLLRKQVQHLLEQRMPLVYRSRYSMVMYSHIPFDLAREAGRIQAGILDELCRGLERAADVDVDRAAQLIAERLTPFLDRHEVSLDY